VLTRLLNLIIDAFKRPEPFCELLQPPISWALAKLLGQDEVWDHPSTGERLVGAAIPCWRETIAAARRCSGALGLGYVGVDLVIDEAVGVQVLECNAYPGLEIQNINAAGLGGRIDWVLSQRDAPARKQRGALHRQPYGGVRPLHGLSETLAGAAGRLGSRLAIAAAEPAVPA
jgi:hypothetical protein